MAICSIPITRRWGRVIRARRAGCCRAPVTEAMENLVAGAGESLWKALAPLIELGINHEEQHQELILMDIKHVFAQNPLKPVYRARAESRARHPAPDLDWIGFKGGLVEIGHGGDG